MEKRISIELTQSECISLVECINKEIAGGYCWRVFNLNKVKEKIETEVKGGPNKCWIQKL